MNWIYGCPGTVFIFIILGFFNIIKSWRYRLILDVICRLLPLPGWRYLYCSRGDRKLTAREYNSFSIIDGYCNRLFSDVGSSCDSGWGGRFKRGWRWCWFKRPIMGCDRRRGRTILWSSIHWSSNFKWWSGFCFGWHWWWCCQHMILDIFRFCCFILWRRGWGA